MGRPCELYHVVPDHPQYEVTSECNMLHNGKYVKYGTRFDFKMGTWIPTVNIDNIETDVPKIMLNTFYGDAPLEYRTASYPNWYIARNLYYDIYSNGGISIDGSNSTAAISFKTIPDYPDYAISSNGIVFDKIKRSILQLEIDKREYRHVLIRNGDARARKMNVNRLVYLTYKGPIPEGYHVDHIDDVTYHNTIDNLQILTPSQNSRKTFISGGNRDKLIFDITISEKICELLQDELNLTEIADILCLDKNDRTYGHIRHMYRTGHKFIEGRTFIMPEIQPRARSNGWSIGAIKKISNMYQAGYSEVDISHYFNRVISLVEISNINKLVNRDDIVPIDYGHVWISTSMKTVPESMIRHIARLVICNVSTSDIENIVRSDIPQSFMSSIISHMRNGTMFLKIYAEERVFMIDGGE